MMVPQTEYGESFEWLPLREEDFRFVGYRRPERFFAGIQRPLRLISTPPAFDVVENALYTPTTRAWKPFDGTIYDCDLRQVPGVMIRRGLEDRCFHSDPTQYTAPVEDLHVFERPLLYLGYINQHYGHFLLESLARWWAMLETYGEHVDRYLVHVHDPQILELPFVRACFDAMHVQQEQIVYFREPTRLRRVLIPEVSFQLDSHVHAVHRTMMNQLVSNVGVDDVNSTEQPLYVSRRGLTIGVREYAGEEEVEALLEERGARIFRPEEHSFAEQVRLFNRHRRIIGIMGSGMHNVVLSLGPKSMVYLAPHRIVESCFLLDRCFGAHSTYLQSCTSFDYLMPKIEQFRQRVLKLSKRRRHGFLVSHVVDSQRVTQWLECSGYFDGNG